MHLTERDFDLLRYLMEQGVATARQLTQRFFPTKGAFHKRICALVKEQLVESVPVTAMKECSQASYFRTSIDLLGTGRSNMAKHRVYRLGERYKKKWPSTAKLSAVHMWRHQLLVNELRFVFEKAFPDGQFLNDPQVLEEWRLWEHWKSGDCSDVPVPDLTIRSGDRHIAVEVERNLKTETNYFSRFMRYESSQYTHVIYYCESEKVFKTVSKLAKNYEWMACARFGTVHEVFRIMSGWTKLDAFLSEFQWKKKREL